MLPYLAIVFHAGAIKLSWQIGPCHTVTLGAMKKTGFCAEENDHGSGISMLPWIAILLPFRCHEIIMADRLLP